MNRAMFFVLGFAVAVADSRGDEPTGTKAGGRLSRERSLRPGISRSRAPRSYSASLRSASR